MFERIKAYRNLKEVDKALEGCQIIAKVTKDPDFMAAVAEAMIHTSAVKRLYWKDRKVAKRFNESYEQLKK